MKPTQVTLKDIARKLGLSTSTVSRALQDHPDISAKTKEAVQKLAQELDYQPNMLALNLRKSKSNMIGVVVPEIVNHFFSTVLSGMESVAYERGYRVMVCQSKESYEREKGDIQALVSSRVDGLLISVAATTTEYDHFERLVSKGVPFVFYDRVCRDFDVSTVEVDDHEGAFKLVEHLIQQGCTKIAHISGPKSSSIALERLKGYVAALATYKIPLDNSLIFQSDMSLQGGMEAAEQILSSGKEIDAIFGMNNLVTLGAFYKLKERGIQIPEEIALGGFTNDPLTCAVEPPITVVAQPGFEIGATAMRLLIERIEAIEKQKNQEKITIPPPVHIKLKGELIIRKSTLKRGY
ncbi:MAG: LacI family transcriptional regulator [Cytophagales bacterium]|nr:LacI family transcriptional regulator [Cytophagales bacterium]MDW8383310.1 LacI family DNA-binding transcriptional regulator [Flammeovirgaceae bacterium]